MEARAVAATEMKDVWSKEQHFYLLLTLLAVTNAELVKLMPWTRAKHGGFPTAFMRKFAMCLAAFANLTQMLFQVIDLGLIKNSIGLATFALVTSVVSFLLRVIKRCIHRPAEQTPAPSPASVVVPSRASSLPRPSKSDPLLTHTKIKTCADLCLYRPRTSA